MTQFGIATKYNLDKDASIRAKVNSNLQVGLGYQQKLRDGKWCLIYTKCYSSKRFMVE